LGELKRETAQAERIIGEEVKQRRAKSESAKLAAAGRQPGKRGCDAGPSTLNQPAVARRAVCTPLEGFGCGRWPDFKPAASRSVGFFRSGRQLWRRDFVNRGALLQAGNVEGRIPEPGEHARRSAVKLSSVNRGEVLNMVFTMLSLPPCRQEIVFSGGLSTGAGCGIVGP
jgi:hypothetical protein